MAVRLRVIITVFAVAGLVIAATTFITYAYGTKILQAHAREEVRRQVIRQLEQLLSTIKDAETGERGFIITGDERYLEPYNAASDRLSHELETIKGMPRIDITQKDVAGVEQLVQAKMADLHSTIELRRSEGFEAAAAATETGRGRKIMDDLRADIARIQTKKTAALEADVKASDEATRVRTFLFIISGLLNIGVLLWAYRRIAEAIRERDVALYDSQKRGSELQMQKDLLSVTLGSIGDCVMVTDETGRITFMNPVAEEVTGWTFGEARDRPVGEVFHILNEQTRVPVENPVQKVIAQGVIVGLANHTLLIKRDGGEVPIDDSGAPIRDADGKIRGVVLVFRDFSEHRQNERELREAKHAAETANKAKDQFLAMLSHELRTPLTPVLATLNLWEASEDVPKSMHGDVQMLRRSIELEARIIDDLLDLTRIARGILSFSPEETDVHALLEFLVGLSRSEIDAKQLYATLNLNAAKHHVYTDAARLQQVIWNILRNAIKFTQTGGITISTSNDADGRIDVSVRDTGIGMTQETIDRLFVPFEQADRSQAKRYGGLGLGMAISRALVELLDGTLTAVSAGVDRGSIFTVSFPTIEAATPSGEPQPVSKVEHGKVKILLIEDHVETAKALVKLLKNRGFKIESVGTVAAGLEAAESRSYDLLICDLGLPDATGFDFVEKVRAKNDRTPAIALTGFGMQQDIERAESAGFDAHLTKPVNLQKLEATIWRLVQNR